jgi:hypothetical protein
LILCYSPFGCQQVLHVFITHSCQLLHLHLHYLPFVPLLTVLLQVNYPVKYALSQSEASLQLSEISKVSELSYLKHFLILTVSLCVVLQRFHLCLQVVKTFRCCCYLICVFVEELVAECFSELFAVPFEFIKGLFYLPSEALEVLGHLIFNVCECEAESGCKGVQLVGYLLVVLA